jgi:hypothetical protein
MNLKRTPRDRSARLELLDARMNSYAGWRDESRAVAESYRDWNSAAAPGRRQRDVPYAPAPGCPS